MTCYLLVANNFFLSPCLASSHACHLQKDMPLDFMNFEKVAPKELVKAKQLHVLDPMPQIYDRFVFKEYSIVFLAEVVTFIVVLVARQLAGSELPGLVNWTDPIKKISAQIQAMLEFQASDWLKMVK